MEINEEFKQATLEVADALDLDELRAAKLMIAVTEDPDTHFQPPVGASIAAFHERRTLITQCLRLLLSAASDDSNGTDIQGLMCGIVEEILSIRSGSNNGSAFARRCISAMEAIDKWQQVLVEQGQKAAVLGQDKLSDNSHLVELQRQSLSEQHEALGACLCYLFRANYTIGEDLRKMVEELRKKDKFDTAVVHYLPAINAAFAQYGSLEGSGSLREARSLDQFIAQRHKTSEHGKLPIYDHVMALLWLAQYSSWYRETSNASPLQGVNTEKESQDRTSLALRILNEGALESLLSICAVLAADEWHDPARQELVDLLLTGSPGLSLDGMELSSAFFQHLFMETVESFVECWITNMPDAIRQLKTVEDDERLHHIATTQDADHGPDDNITDIKLHLESFLVLISFAFEHRPEAAEAFWADSDSNLYGFLRWASKRQTVPRVSAFCDMLCAVSEGATAGEAAHKFLLEDEYQSASRFRKSPSLNYGQMLAELEFYSTKVHERPQSRRPLPSTSDLHAVAMNELESPVMLSCYLRLMTHMCEQSVAAREFLSSNKTLDVVTVLFQLSAGPVPSYLRASIFVTLRALLTNKFLVNSHDMWTRIDQWSSGSAGASGGSAQGQGIRPRLQNVLLYLENIASSTDQANAYVALLKTLLQPAADTHDQTPETLTFPENLGANYRSPGLEPYIDFVMGMVFAKRLGDVQDESPNLLLRFNCLDFIATCLETFDGQVVDAASQKSGALQANPGSIEEKYVLRHPFARVMEWLFSTDVIRVLFSCSRAPLEQVHQSPSDSILIAALQRSIDILNLILTYEADYLDVVRPLVKNTTSGSNLITDSGFSTFEDCIFNFSSSLGDFREYAGTGHDELVLRSLALLQKLATSRRLTRGLTFSNGVKQARNPISILDPRVTDDATSINLIMRMRFNMMELEQGPEAASYVIKDGICAFLNGCLEALPDVPNIAHPLLGFSVVGQSLAVPPDGLIDSGASLFHSLLQLVQSYPDGEGINFRSWFLHLKRVSFQVFQNLWSSELSAGLAVGEMRKARFLTSLLSNQQLIGPDSLWDDVPLGAEDFFFATSAEALAEFLAFRALLFEYALTELRTVSQTGLTAAKSDIVAILLGQATDISRRSNQSVTLFDLFDIAEVDDRPELRLPRPTLLSDFDMGSCSIQSSNSDMVLYDLDKVKDSLQSAIFRNGPSLGGSNPDKDRIRSEAEEIFQLAEASNRVQLVRLNKTKALQVWVELATLTLESCSSAGLSQAQFSLQLLQLILPKLEILLLDSTNQTIDLARLADTLIKILEKSLDDNAPNRLSGIVHDKVRHLFSICLTGIHAPNSTSRLRCLLYTICSRYLRHITSSNVSSTTKWRQQSLDAVTRAGARVMNTICNDADTADDSCRLSALVFLNMLAALGQKQNSPLILQFLIQVNFIDALIEPIKTIAVDLQESSPDGKPCPPPSLRSFC